eukprot:TRINITY_DN2111_c0_g1_i2.p1 TRINITY_DN2111_c0_g1~~TRINITY_DN2111_c0_g1_i2.p1  ORF type:complete len:1328 (-),score=528.23 TRINITY_DN2111_c0_g1_i2:125-4108(-)
MEIDESSFNARVNDLSKMFPHVKVEYITDVLLRNELSVERSVDELLNRLPSPKTSPTLPQSPPFPPPNSQSSPYPSSNSPQLSFPPLNQNSKSPLVYSPSFPPPQSNNAPVLRTSSFNPPSFPSFPPQNSTEGFPSVNNTNNLFQNPASPSILSSPSLPFAPNPSPMPFSPTMNNNSSSSLESNNSSSSMNGSSSSIIPSLQHLMLSNHRIEPNTTQDIDFDELMSIKPTPRGNVAQHIMGHNHSNQMAKNASAPDLNFDIFNSLISDSKSVHKVNSFPNAHSYETKANVVARPPFDDSKWGEKQRVAALKINKFVRRGRFWRASLRYIFMAKQRQKTLSDFFISERRYAVLLTDITNSIVAPVASQRLLSNEDASQLFGNIKDIAEFHSGFLNRFVDKMRNYHHFQNISDLFLELVPVIVIYQDYARNYNPDLLSSLSDSNKKFSNFVSKCKSHENGEVGKTYINHLLKLPIDRIAQFESVLRDLCSYTGTYHPDYQGTKLAYDSIKNSFKYLKRNKSSSGGLKQHKVAETKISGKTWCFFCNDFILNTKSTAFRCSLCNKAFHTRCCANAMESDQCPFGQMSVVANKEHSYESESDGKNTLFFDEDVVSASPPTHPPISSSKKDKKEKKEKKDKKEKKKGKKDSGSEVEGVTNLPNSQNLMDSDIEELSGTESKETPTENRKRRTSILEKVKSFHGKSDKEEDKKRNPPTTERKKTLEKGSTSASTPTLQHTASSSSIARARKNSLHGNQPPIIFQNENFNTSNAAKDLNFLPPFWLATRDLTDDIDGEELSKDEENSVQWVAKLKKAPKSRLFTFINLTGSVILERGKFFENKGKWRRKPPQFIYVNSPVQFGVEGKSLEGGVAFTIDDCEEPLVIYWTSYEKDTTNNIPLCSFKLPEEMAKKIVITQEARINDKFCDVKFELRDLTGAPITKSNSTVENGISRSSSTSSLNSTPQTDAPLENNNQNSIGFSPTSSYGSSPFNATTPDATSTQYNLPASPYSQGSNSKKNEKSSATEVPSEFANFKYSEYNVNNSTKGASSDDSDEEDREEEKKRALFKTMKLIDPSSIQEDPEALKNATASLKLAPTSGTSTIGRGRRRPRGNTNPDKRGEVTDDELLVARSVPPSESEPEDSTPSRRDINKVEDSETEEEIEVDIDERTKQLMKNAFVKLESGSFADALKDVNQTLKYFVSISNPKEKQRESKICAIYKHALLILIAKASTQDQIKVASLTRQLAEIALQPKHRLICIRMAIKCNMDVGNFGISARFLETLLPLNLVDKSKLEANLVQCNENGRSNAHCPFDLCPTCQRQTNGREADRRAHV